LGVAFLVAIVDDLVMAHGFVRVDRDQQFLLPPDLRSWLPADHEVWFVIDLVERLDLSALESSYRLGAQGRAPVSPTMLLTLLVWGYSRGVVSSRRIERACREDVAFRVICANDAPDHTTIARFRQRHESVAAELFVQVLAMCDRAGLVSLGVVAVDGTKMSANAALGANRSVGRLREQVAAMFAEADAVDAAEDEEFGDRNGAGMPAELVDETKRRERIAELLAELDAEDTTRERVNTTDLESRIMHTADGGNVQGYNAQVVCGQAQVVLAASVTNEGNDSHQLIPMLDELDSNRAAAGIAEELGTVLADAGYFTAANVADVDKREVDALIATAKRRDQPVDGSTHDPVVESAAWAAFNADQERIANELDAERRRRAAIFERVDTSGLDIRDHIDELGVCQSIAYTGLRHWRLGGVDAIPVPPPRWRVRRPARSPAQVARDLMNDRFANPDNQALFKQRSHLVETYFGNTKQNRGITRFARRGLAAVNAEWQLIATVNNIDKLHRATN
jgi:transposase